MNVDSLINLITAIATIATVPASIGIAVWQLKRTFTEDAEQRLENRYYDLRREAFLVDAWISRAGRNWKLIINNSSNGVVREVQIHVHWPSLDGRDQHLDSHKLHVAPRSNKPWEVIPQGAWEVAPGNVLWTWDYPRRIDATTENSPSPVFFKPSSTRDLHEVVTLQFKDIYDNRWCRVYSADSTPDGMEVGLHLIESSTESFKKYVNPSISLS